MTELQPNYGRPKEHQGKITVKLNTKFVQSLGKYGVRIDVPAAKAYLFPVAVIKHGASPVGVYELVDFKDLPDELLAKFGLQKLIKMLHVIPVNDIKPHEELSTCHCGPRLIMENGEMILIHKSFDGREANEFSIGEVALRRNHNFPDEPDEWIEFIVNETYLSLISEYPEDFQKIPAEQQQNQDNNE